MLREESFKGFKGELKGDFNGASGQGLKGFKGASRA